MDLSKYPKLTKEQVGHVRHFYNLATQPDGEWHHMGTQEPMQEFLDAYRYQLATMAYATAATHFHHQNALRSVYKPLMRQLIHKMLLRQVWGYWFTTSLGGTVTDPSLTELRQPWADPIVKENIMYSGHLLLMTSLYAMLFDDDEFERDESMIFHWNPLFYGLGSETFSYTNQSLQEAILREMERNGWVGVCCEPNAVFVVCNQFPIIAMRLNDVRHKTNVIEGVLEKYLAAWEQKGMVGENGLFKDMWLVKQDFTVPAMDPAFSAWACAFMNSCNSDFVLDGKTALQPAVVGNAYRQLAAKDEYGGAKPSELLKKAVEIAKTTSLEAMAAKSPTKPLSLLTKPTMGYVAQWLSELGRPESKGLLDFADESLNPTWEKGGLYYPRHDEPMDENLQWTHMDPYSGNAALGYARLNVTDGTKAWWDKPWTQDELQTRPWVDGVSLADGVDFLRGVWDEQERILFVTVKTWDGGERTIRPVFKNLAAGRWSVHVDGKLYAEQEMKQGGQIPAEVAVGGRDVDIVVSRSA